MLKRTRALIQEASAYITFWPFVGGTALVSALSGYLAHISAWLHPYAPISWLAAAMLGAGIFVSLAAGVVGIRNAAIDGSIRRRFYEGANRVDPLKRHFTRERVNILDLVPPMGGAIEDRTFEDCELIGPANLFITANGQGMLVRNTFVKTDGVSIRDGAIPQTATVMLNCRFLRCTFFNVVLLFHEDIHYLVNQQIEGLNWITVDPIRNDVNIHPIIDSSPPSPKGATAKTKE
jgi:hypothetical protein